MIVHHIIMSSRPVPGTMWTGQGFDLLIIEKDDPRNIREDGSYKRTGDVIYVYLNGPVGKVGNYRQLDNFIKINTQISTSKTIFKHNI